MSDLFYFEGFQIRFVGTPEKPEWVAADILAILYPEADSRNYSNYLNGIRERWKGHKKIMTPGGLQGMTTLFEPGLYFLLNRSNSLIAEPFQDWLNEDLLPTLRKTGSYSLQQGQQLWTEKMIALEEKHRELDLISTGMDLMAQLGGIDERTELQIKDLVKTLILEEKLQKTLLPGSQRIEYPVSDRIIQLGYGVQPIVILQRIGKAVAALYKTRYGKNPPKREQFVDGTTRLVNCYGEDDLDILDQAIKQILQ